MSLWNPEYASTPAADRQTAAAVLPLLLLLAGLLVAGACDESPAGLDDLAPDEGAVEFRASLRSPTVSTLVVEVTAPDIPDPLVFNMELVGSDTDGDGVDDAFTASDVLTVPAGADRLFTVRAFDDAGIRTHEGANAMDVQPGTNNEALLITLDPLTGEQPIEVVLGSFDVLVTPRLMELGPGERAVVYVRVVDGNGDPVETTTPVELATSNPAVVRVLRRDDVATPLEPSTLGTRAFVTGGANGVAGVVGTWQGVGSEVPLPLGINAGISGDRIVWADDPNGDFDVFVMDLGDESVTPIALPGDQYDPVIVGDLVAWTDTRGGTLDVVAMDLATGEELGPGFIPGDQYDPVVEGDLMAWTDTRNGDLDVLAMDLGTGTEGGPGFLPGDQYDPAVDEDLLAWTQAGEGGLDVRAMNLADGSSIGPEFLPGDQYDPEVVGTTLFFVDADVDGEIDVASMDLAAVSPSPVPVELSGDQFDPVFVRSAAGDFLAFAEIPDARRGTGDLEVRVLSLETGSDVGSGLAPGNQFDPAMDGTRVIWTDLQGTDASLILLDLETGELRQVFNGIYD